MTLGVTGDFWEILGGDGMDWEFLGDDGRWVMRGSEWVINN